MFYRIYTIKLGSLANAKLAAAFFTETFEKDGHMLPVSSIEILFDSDGSLIIQVGVKSMGAMKRFNRYGDALLEELRESFTCRTEKFTTVSVFRYTPQIDKVAV